MTEPLPVARIEYLRAPIEGFETDQVPPAPLALFGRWLADVVEVGLPEPNAATLATAAADGQPSVRMMLVKIVDAQGFCFFTNYESRKGLELAANPRAALSFGWHAIHRQVSVSGRVERVSREESRAYFATRPRGAQLGAWASQQSRPVSREELDARFAEMSDRFGEDAPVPIPEHWGGFRLVPDRVDFWVGRFSRLHDRIEYRRVGPGGLDDETSWEHVRLSP